MHVHLIVFLFYYIRQGERSERWRRLRDWSFCPSVRVHDDLSFPRVIHNTFYENFYILQ